MHVLFVCTHNIFRSMSAEYILRDLLVNNSVNDVTVSSAGTVAWRQSPYLTTYETLESFGVDASAHTQTKLTPEVCENADVIVCMTHAHLDAVKRFGYKGYLFNELAYGKSQDLQDDDEATYNSLHEFVKGTVIYIHDSMPQLWKGVEHETQR